MRPRHITLAVLFAILAGLPLLKTGTVYSSDRLEEGLRRYFENEPVLLKVHVPADKNGFNYYPFRNDKKIDYVGRGVSIFKGATATIFRVKVKGDYIEFQFNEGGGQTVGRIFTKSDWPFDGKNYGGRVNVRFERDVSGEDLSIQRMKQIMRPIFCLVKDSDKDCYMDPLPESLPPEPAEAAPKTPGPTVNLKANPPSVARGECSTLRWKSTHADDVEITELGSVAAQGQQEVCPEKDTCYEAVASGPGGKAADEACVTLATPKVDDGFARSILDVFFALDRSELSNQARFTLDANIRWLQQHPEVRFFLEGHCDERATAEYNLGLGMRRAQSVRDYLMRNGVSGDRFTVVTYGEERPFESCHGERCWNQNRRVHFAQQ